MISKASFWIIVALVVIGGALFFIFSPSYQKSLEAKWYYTFDHYEEAYKLASEAYELDKYNKMAFTVMQQSKRSSEILKYINEAVEYKKKIEEIAKGELDNAKRVKIKLICEIMIAKYAKLSPTRLTDKELIEESTKARDWFQKILDDAY